MSRTAVRRHTPGQAEPEQRLPGESHADWRQRLALAAHHRRTPGEALLTPEMEASGDFAQATVTHVETGTRAATRRRRNVSALAAMHERGAITPAQFEASRQIADTAERLARAVSIGTMRWEPRIDCAGSGRDFVAERLAHMRLEATYARWRERLPMPRRLVIDMVLADRDLVATARTHAVPWREARRRLIAALYLWQEVRGAVWRQR
ncbi:MAG: hypothetical protein KGK11_10510 [Sphingomonadales bacterium]|nr:hypothetical protein [Sphingomonadales bacterium]